MGFRVGLALFGMLGSGLTWASALPVRRLISLGNLPGASSEIEYLLAGSGGPVYGSYLPSASASLYEGHRWSFGTGFSRLVGENGLNILPSAVSRSGDLVVGSAQALSGHFAAAIWSPAGGIRLLEPFSEASESWAWTVSADGNVIAGQVGDAACLWNRSGARTLIASAKADLIVKALTADGRKAFLSGHSSLFRDSLYVWTKRSGLARWTLPAPVPTRSSINWISPDGETMVGETGETPMRGFVWNRSRGVVLLKGFGGRKWASAAAATASGRVVVGWSGTKDEGDAFIWDAANGIRTMASYLGHLRVKGLASWRLRLVSGISGDGSVILGSGRSPVGRVESWIVRIR